MDRELIIYIIFAIVYFVLRMLKKKPEPPDATPREPKKGQGEYSPREGPVTFEDLLRELTGQKPSQQAPAPQPGPAQGRKAREFQFPSDGDNYEEPYDEWADKKVSTLKEGSSTRVFSDEESKHIYEQSIYQAQSQEDELDQQLKRAKSRFKEFEIQEEDNSAIREELVDMLQSPEGAKKAIILGEILNRRY